MELKTYVFFGNVGAGKGTQIKLLQKLLTDKGEHVIYLSPGSEYRTIVSSGSYTGSVVKSTLDVGKLLPDAMTTGLFTEMLTRELTPESIVITDGYPRSIQQSHDFINMIEFYGCSSVEIVNINISKEEAVKRMKLRGRADDTDEGIASRFDVYENSVLPALEILKQKGYVLHKINGEQSVKDVHSEIIKALNL